MNVDTDKLEERAAVILGQIQASVAEYVRAMNEAGALRRREADEAHRQQDEAIRALQTIQLQAKDILESHSRFASKAGADWLNLVDRGLKGIAIAQAAEVARVTQTNLELCVSDLNAALREVVRSVDEIARKNDRICRALAWRTVFLTACWIGIIAIVAAVTLT